MNTLAYKAFDKDLKCRGHQYEVGQTYTHDGRILPCKSGFHSCLSPFDCWNYYDVTGSRFALVEVAGETKEHGNDSKIASAEITIKAELSLAEFVKSGVDWLITATKGKEDSGDDAKIGSSGNYAKIGSSGNYAKIGSSGDDAKIEATGENSVIASAGINAKAKGAGGTWVSIAEFKDGNCVGFVTGCIGQGGLKPDTYYLAKNGKLVEVT